MVMELNIARPARPPASGCSASFTSLATPNGSSKSTVVPYSINPNVHANRTPHSDSIHGALITFDKRDATEVEFSSQSHLIILLSDGISGGCEWSNGSQAGKLASVAPNTIIFNPACTHLLIRKKASQRHCRIWLLNIDPTLLNCLDVGDTNVAGFQFRQQIGIEDQGVLQALIAVKQEIEAPGPNSRLYVDTLLMLLLTRLMRCRIQFSYAASTRLR